MLQQMRSMKTLIFWFVAITFLVGFVFLGDGLKVGRSNRQGNKAYVAEINGEKVPYETYSSYVNQLVEMDRRQYQREDLSTSDYDRIEAQAWDGLISEMLVRQEAQKLNLRAGDEEIVATLTQSPPSFIRQRFTDEQGQFNQAAFQSAVNDPNFNWGPAEQYLRSALPSLKLEKMVRARAQVSEDEVRQEFARRNQRTKVRYAGTAWQSIDLGSWTPSDADMHAFYDKHPERFMRGETVSLEIIKVAKKPSADDEADATDNIKKALDDEKNGTETFAQLAEIYSDDASATRGGDLGWLSPASLPGPLGVAAAKLAAGQTTPEALRTESGYVLLHADSVRTTAAGTQMRLREIVVIPKASGETLDALRTHVFEVAPRAKKDLAAAALELGTTVEKLEPVEAMGFLPSIGFAKRLVDWAFAAQPGDVSDPIGTDGAILIAKLVAKNPKAPRPFDQVVDQARAGAQEQAKKDRARAQMERVLAQVKGGASLDAAAKAAGLTASDPAPFNYYESVPGVGAANEFTAVASTLEPGKTSGVIETNAGTYVVQVVSRDAFDDNAFKTQRQ
ncbi:MAG: peptidyl-prolyl cis-trans isomerase, partial [Casimicrobiaceae bacterium]